MKSLPLGKITRRTFGAGVNGGLASGGYAWGVEPRRLTVTRRTLTTPRLPGALDGLRVVVMSDIHYDPDWQESSMLAAVEAANDEDADLILLPGDFITDTDSTMETLAPLLGRLRARHGVFASMGNHDGWHGGTQVRAALEKQGIAFLLNQSTRLNLRGQRLDVAGTDSIWSGHPDAGKTFGGTKPETTIVLVHEPDPFDALGDRSLLQVSGHTHGGQCRVPLIGYAPVTVRYGRKYIYGDFEQPSGGRLFVTRGLGTVGLRVRFACEPEIAVLTLRAG